MKRSTADDAFFQTLVEASGAAILAAEAGLIHYASPAAARLLARDATHLEGKRLDDYFEPGPGCTFADLGSIELPTRIFVCLLSPGGSPRPVELCVSQVELDGRPFQLITLLPDPIGDLLQAIVDAVVLYGPDGRVARANPISHQYYGFDPTGLRLDEILERLEVRSPDGTRLKPAEMPSTRALHGQRVQAERLLITNPDGRTYHISVSTAPLSEKAGAVVVWHDITQVERLLAENRLQRGLLEGTFDADPSGVAVLAGPDLVFVHTNRAYRALTPHPEIDPLGLPYDQVWPSGESLAQREILGAVRDSGQPADIERNPRRFPDGSLRTYSLHARQLDWNGQPAVLDVLWETTALETARRLAEEAAEDTHHLADELDAVINSISEAVIIYGSDGKAIRANPAAMQALGFNPLIASQQGSLQRLFASYPESRPLSARQTPVARVLRGETVSGERFLVQAPDRPPVTVLVSAAPLVSGGQARGVVVIWRDMTAQLQAEEGARRQAARMQLLDDLGQAFASAGLYYPSVLSTISRRVAEAIADACLIRLVSDDGQWLDPVAFHHTDGAAMDSYRRLLRGSRKPAGQTGLAPDAAVLDLTPDEIRELEPEAPSNHLPQAALQVPLRSRVGYLGTLTVVRTRQPLPFTADDRIFLQDIGDRAALAIENARLYAAEAQRARELQALHSAASTLLSNLDLESLVGQILEVARGAIPVAERGLLHLAEGQTSELKVRAMLGFRNPAIQRGGFGTEYVAAVVRDRKPALINNLPAAEKGQRAGPRSVIVAPLTLGRRVLGALSLTSSSPGAFSESDLRLLVSLAATTGAAIQNALLHSEIQRLAVTDLLTEQYNRRGFFEAAEREMQSHLENGHPLCAIMLDIDHFKLINDTHGHSVGDQMLTTLARRCRANIRSEDVLGRYGGEEFMILLPETALDTATEIAERIRRSIASEPISTSEGPVEMTVSLGIVQAGANTLTLAALLDLADKALYRAKQAGRNRVEQG